MEITERVNEVETFRLIGGKDVDSFLLGDHLVDKEVLQGKEVAMRGDVHVSTIVW